MRDFIKKVSILFIILFLSVPLALMGQILGSAAANEGGSTIEVGGNTKITQNGCSRKIEKTEKISWRLPRKPVDLVILQDASGSFKNTIPNVQNALKTLTTFVKEEEYDENNPRLVKTDNPDTSDRVMMATFQGADGYNYYYNNDFTGRKDVYGSWGPDYDYKYKASNLSSDQNDIHQFINNIKVAGGTPTVPAIDDVIAQYNERKGNMANGRKTIFLLITDGVANGKRDPDGKVRLEYSDYRNNILTRAWNFNELTEASQNVLGRVKEVKEASTRLKNVVGSEGTVVVGFWEDVTIFANSKAQYYDTYKEGYSKYFDIGDNRSVQEIFHEALEGMASPAKNINGKDVSFYVNEQSDINKFSSRVLESVGAALVKEDIKGEFEVTPGYKVDAVRINGKKIVSKVTDSKKEIRGKIVQEGDKVTISVPESVFNPGNNKFDYDLSKEAHAEQVDEDDEQDPPADYKPVKETVPVPELTGKFKVGDFATETIGGSKETVEVQKLEYCYPSATKKIADQDQSNDTGTIEDPLQLTKKPSYAANLSAKDETFTYTVDYNFNNAPYEFKKNVMLTDPLDYRLEVVGHHASGPQGQILTRVVKQNDDLGNEREVVVADVPSVNGYEYLVLQKAKMTITVRLKEQYRNNQASKEFMALLQDNDGFGLLNQGNIMWNGEDNNPDPSKHAKTADKPSTIRRSNPVYVKPPVVTEITKKVNDKEHEDLKAEEELFEYKVTVPWPGIADTFSLTDTVVSELEVQADSLNVKLGEKDNTDLKTAAKVEGQTVSLTLDKTQLEKISRKVTRRKTKDVQYLELTFKAKIRPGADLSKYKEDGQIKVPNTADVALNDIKKTSNEVTVTPPKPKEPSIDKKINENLDSFQTFDGQPYNYNITTAVPSDVANYKKFVIRDTLDANLELAGDVSIKGSAAALFDIHTNGQEITATVKDGQFGELAKYSTVELVIPAKVKNGVTGTTIENKASISFTNENNVEKEVESKPVTVTPPPVTKKINETLDHLDIAIGQAYNYNIKTKLPTDITDYKKFVITDTLEGDLSVINETSSKPVIKGPAAAFFDVTVEGQTVTATMKDFANATALAGQEVELIIPAKINDGVTRINIPNTAKFSFTDKNDHSGEKETKPVTVTPPSEPGVDKKINETLTEATIGAETDFTYNIKAKLPNDITTYKSFVVTDTLDENLTPGQAEIKGAAAKFFDVTVQGQTVTATMKDFANAGDYGNQEVELVIHAKVKKGSTVPSIENKAKITYTNKNDQQGEKETKPVTVTPPPITKKVNGQEHADLGKLSEIFTYTIDSTVPHMADSFTISDDIVKELAFEGEATVTVDGQAVQDLTVTTEGQRLTVTFGKEQVKQYAGKAVQVSFKAKVKEGITFDALLAAYPNESKDKPVVPNTASYIINDNPDSKKESKPVTVTPPTTTPELKKEVNGAERYDLAKRNEEFTYTLKTTMPANATVFEMTDELKEVLEFVGENASATVKLDGEDAGSKATVTISGQVIKVAFTESSVKADAGKSIEVNFKAKIRDNANLSAYVNKDGKTEIPNKASYDIDHNPKYHKDSNEVPVTPPTPEEPEIKKDVNGKESATLAKRDEVFTYNVKTSVAQDATAFSVTDILVDVLEFAGTSSAKLNGQALDASQIKVEGQTITLTLTEEQVKANGGQAVELTFDAKIKAGANLSAYVKEDGRTQIPNKASYDASFPHKPGVHKDSNEVPVTPPTPEEPEIKKDVNGKAEATLAKRDEVFTYNVKTSVAQDATAFSVTDTLVDVLEFAGTSSAKLNGQALDASQIKVEGQIITLTLTEEQVKANGGQAVELTFDAKIKAGANLSAYLSEDKTVKVPNKAAYKADLPNKPGFTKDSNEVPVTPPTPEEPEIKKDVNGKEAETLDKRDQVFTYNVKTTVAQDATAFSVTDTLVDVLEFAGTSSAKLNGQALEASQIKVEGQTITLTLTEEQVKANGGQAVELTFDAKIKAGANLSAYLSEDKTVKVPNKAAYKADLPNKPGFTKDSNEVPVTPPTPEEPEIKKDVNGKEAETLDKRDQVFTYNVKTTVAQDATVFAVTDTLVDVLEFAGTSSAKLNGQALEASQIKVEGQTITLTLTEEQAKTSAGQAVELTFDAKIKAGANLSDYVTEDKSIKVPNKAAYKVDLPNKPGFTKDSNEVPVTPPTPEEPEIKKDVNTKAEETLADRDQVFTYNVKTSVPTDATVFSVSDTLESVLDYAGSANASLNGQALDASQIKVEGQTITLTLTKEQVKANGGQAVELSFTAKIKAGADLTPYLTDRGFTVPNTASYDAKFPHKPGLHKDSNKVPVIVPKEPEPEISKKINRTLDHLDVEYDAPYMYNVNTTLPKDIDKYKEFTVTDTLEPVLEIADTPVAYVDGRDANGALETSVEGNTVTVKVKDFARLKGFKEIQLYIPAKLKANSDLKAYKDQLVPNKATVNFKDANGQSGSKESKPVTVKPRDPEKPTDPTPGEPAKTVGPENGSTPGTSYNLPNATDTFRFDITTPVPTDPVDENGNAKKDQYGRLVKTDLTNFTVSDEIHSVLKVNKDRIALKVENAQFDKLKVALQAQLEQAEKELKALTGKSTEETSTEIGKKEELKAAEAKVAELKAKLEAAKAAQPAKPAETTTPATPATAAEETTPATSDSSATEDKKPATSEPSQGLASLEAELKAAEETLAKLQAPAEKEAELAPADKKQQQEKLENEIKKLKEAQTKLQAAIDKLSKASNDRGELVGKELEAIATITYDEAKNIVTLEISDKDVLEALKGSKVTLVLYTNFREGTDFAQFATGVPNTAKVSFNDKSKTTNKVVVTPPVPVTPPAPNIPPAEGDIPKKPTEPGKTLPNTGSEVSTVLEVFAALAAGLAGLLVWKRKAER